MRNLFLEGILLAFICGALLLPGAAFRGPTGLEFRTGIFVRGILDDGPTLIPRLDGTPYFDYPPLYFLAAAAASSLTGAITPLSLALPSMLAAMGTILLVFLFAGRADRSLGRTAAIALIVTPLFMDCSSQGAVDATLLLFVSLALLAYHAHLSNGSTCCLILSYLGLAGALLTKGPIGAAIPVAAIGAYNIARRQWRPLAASAVKMGLFLLLLAALYIGVLAIWEGTPMLRKVLDAQVLNRVTDEPNAPRSLYLGVFFAGFAPWSVFAFLQLFRRVPEEGDSLLTFCKAWLLSTALLFSLATIKHTRYLLPAAPPTAILCAAFWRSTLGQTGGRCFGVLLAWIRRLCMTVIIASIPFGLIAPLWLPHASVVLTAAIPMAGALALACTRLKAYDERQAAFSSIAWMLALGFLIYCQFILPLTNAREEARPFVERVEMAAGDGPIVFFDLERDQEGLKYLYWRRKRNRLTFVQTGNGLRRSLPPQGGGLLVSRAKHREALQNRGGDRLHFLFEGMLGKRECAVFSFERENSP